MNSIMVYSSTLQLILLRDRHGEHSAERMNEGIYRSEIGGSFVKKEHRLPG